MKKFEVDARGALIIAKALAYAVKVIQGLPPRWQEASDAEDMMAMLEEIGEPWSSIAVQSANHHINGAKGESNA